MDMNELFLYGEIIDHPICTFTEIRDDGVIIGFVYPIKTTQLVDYEIKEVVTWINSVYDLKKWNILYKGDRVKLSVLKKINSNYNPDGKALKCNIASRERKRI